MYNNNIIIVTYASLFIAMFVISPSLTSLRSYTIICIHVSIATEKEKETTQGQLDVQLQTIARYCTKAFNISSRQGEARLYQRHMSSYEIRLHELVIDSSV